MPCLRMNFEIGHIRRALIFERRARRIVHYGGLQMRVPCGAICLTATTVALSKSGQVTLGHWYSTARVSKRLTHRSAACLRARYCADLAWLDLLGSPIRKEARVNNSLPESRTLICKPI